jgi:hypothetical protein
VARMTLAVRAVEPVLVRFLHQPASQQLPSTLPVPAASCVQTAPGFT